MPRTCTAKESSKNCIPDFLTHVVYDFLLFSHFVLKKRSRFSNSCLVCLKSGILLKSFKIYAYGIMFLYNKLSEEEKVLSKGHLDLNWSDQKKLFALRETASVLTSDIGSKSVLDLVHSFLLP